MILHSKKSLIYLHTIRNYYIFVVIKLDMI